MESINHEHRPREFMTEDAKKERRDNQVSKPRWIIMLSWLSRLGGSSSILDEAYFNFRPPRE